jgi:hypothetical protein
MSDDQKTAALKAAALRAGMIDLDALALADTGKVTLGAYGSVIGADEVVAQLKHDKPHLFMKKMKEMTPAEQATWWDEHKKKFPDGGPKPEPMDLTKHARDMTEREREAFVKECARRTG